MRSPSKTCGFIISAIIAPVIFSSAWASSDILVKENNDFTLQPNSEYWTPERLRNAKPVPMPRTNPDTLREIPTANLRNSNGDADGGDGQPPSVEIKPLVEQLYPSRYQLPLTQAKTFLDHGSSNENFSSSRLIPLSADHSYPYTTVGKLFFTIPGQGDYVCSASVLRHRVLLTAGHCVHKGSGGVDGFYSNWLFVPAFRDGAAPYQSWKWKYVAVTGTWASGNGSVPNEADYAMLELEDRSFIGVLRRIGEVTGYLGYQTQSLASNHAHLLGYPCNLDKCQKMHQVAAQSAKTVAPNNVEYGSDMRGGSSGGPWVQNFGALADGQTGGTNKGLNRVIGITSWGFVSTTPMSQGSSIPDNRFIDLLNKVCAHKAGNCS